MNEVVAPLVIGSLIALGGIVVGFALAWSVAKRMAAVNDQRPTALKEIVGAFAEASKTQQAHALARDAAMRKQNDVLVEQLSYYRQFAENAAIRLNAQPATVPAPTTPHPRTNGRAMIDDANDRFVNEAVPPDNVEGDWGGAVRD